MKYGGSARRAERLRKTLILPKSAALYNQHPDLGPHTRIGAIRRNAERRNSPELTPPRKTRAIAHPIWTADAAKIFLIPVGHLPRHAVLGRHQQIPICWLQPRNDAGMASIPGFGETNPAADVLLQHDSLQGFAAESAMTSLWEWIWGIPSGMSGGRGRGKKCTTYWVADALPMAR